MSIYKTLFLLLLTSILVSACGGGSTGSLSEALLDDDNDTILNSEDNCLAILNTAQLDSNNDGIGDACEISTSNSDNPTSLDELTSVDTDEDTDSDGVPNIYDEFPNDSLKASSITSAHRLLTQATFGATEEEIDRVVKIGTHAWIDEQLEIKSAYDNKDDNHKTHFERIIEVGKAVQPEYDWYRNYGIFNQQGNNAHIHKYRMSVWLENALESPKNDSGSDQLRQRIAYALSQLLVVSDLSGQTKNHAETVAIYNDILAKNAFGNYRDLLGEISRSTAMGMYLSHMGNDKANPEKNTHPDENFARELMQLFTIGLYKINIDGTPILTNEVPTPVYTQNDVVELAKVMTGWDRKGNRPYGGDNSNRGLYSGSMEFHPKHHEDEVAEGGDGNVTVIGKTFSLKSGNDQSAMDSALDVLFDHQNIAPFVSKHLIKQLITSNPNADYVARVSAVFNDNGKGIKGDLKAVVKAILYDPEARDINNRDNANFGKVKEPILAWTQYLRIFGVQPLQNWGPSKVQDVYFFKRPEDRLNQGPLRAGSVFNFYSPDYVPSNAYFSNNKLVTPEAQIISDQFLVSYHNSIRSFVSCCEKQYLTKVKGKNLTEYASKRSLFVSHLMLVDYDRELSIIQQKLDNEFSNIKNVLLKEKAIHALLEHLDKVMLGNTMTEKYQSLLSDYLLNTKGLENNDAFKEAHNIVRESIRFIATSSAYMIQK
ncbi:MAG: DUF1800 family protein [Cocleimonas sp.]